MKAIRHFAVGVTGRIDLNGLSRRVAERHPEVSIKDCELQNAVPCKVLSPISQGSLDIQDTVLDFSLDIYVFQQGVFLFEISMEADELPGMILETGFMTEQVSITSGERRSQNPLFMHAWMFLFNLLDFEEVISRLGEVGSFSEEGQTETHDAIYETSLIDSFYQGEQTYLQTVRGASESVIICNPSEGTVPEDSAEPVYDSGSRVCRMDNVFYSTEEDDEFLDLFRFLVYRRNIMGVFNKVMSDWLEAVGEQSKLIRNNLKETNKVYWSRLKRRLEVWDLNFLDIFACANGVINSLEGVDVMDLEPPYSDTISKEYSRSRQLLVNNMDSLKYSIANLRTPCEAHDEDLLQKETEKVNERIMLLSFLAMSIPLLGAILAPGISTATKLVAAVVLFTLPAAYLYFRKVQKKKGHRKATVSYLLDQKKKLEAEIRNTRKTLDGIIAQDKLDEKTRTRATEFIRKSLKTSEKYLEDLEREIRKYG